MTTKNTPGLSDEGRLYEIQAEVARTAKGPYVLTPDIVVQPLTRGQAKKMRTAENEEVRARILLGDAYDAADALFEDRDVREWVQFVKELQDHFYGKGATEVPGGSQGS
ncbi:hypothetical protein ACWEQ4_01295 [Rhodococcus sp. NPDC003994]